jgi:hypothetical protein
MLSLANSGPPSASVTTRLNEYVEQYKSTSGSQSSRSRRQSSWARNGGLLGQLFVRSAKLARIGKEVNRFDQDEGVSLEPDQPVEYERDDLLEDIAYLAVFPQEATARDLGLTVRGWRNLYKGLSKPRSATGKRIASVASSSRLAERFSQ